jgi:hypothetical protein
LIAVGSITLVIYRASSQESVPQEWTIRESRPVAMPGARPAYWGFPFSLQAPIPNGWLRMTVACGSTAPAANPCIADNEYPGTGLDIFSRREVGGRSTSFVAGFSPGAIGKVLYRHGSRLFHDPATGRRHDGAIFYSTQRISSCAGERCGIDGKWIAYTDDGTAFVGHRRILPDCSELSPPRDRRCHDSSWWCDQGWPCDPVRPRSWWTEGDMAPLYADGRFLALAYSYEYARPGRPTFSNAEIWTLESDDGNEWRRGHRVSSGNAQLPYFQRDCIRGPWMMNSDIARDRDGNYFVTRAYSDNYAGCDVTFPNRIQVYAAGDRAGLVAGPWRRLVDLGCAELGFQPDSAQIIHDGLGNAVENTPGLLSLAVAVSGGDWTYSLCGRETRHRGSCGPPPEQRVQEVTIGRIR